MFIIINLGSCENNSILNVTWIEQTGGYDHLDGQLIQNFPVGFLFDNGSSFLSLPFVGLREAISSDPAHNSLPFPHFFDLGGDIGASNVDPMPCGGEGVSKNPSEVPLYSWSSIPSLVTQDPFPISSLQFDENEPLKDFVCFPYPVHMENLGVFMSLPSLVSPLHSHHPLFSSPPPSGARSSLLFRLELIFFPFLLPLVPLVGTLPLFPLLLSIPKGLTLAILSQRIFMKIPWP
jgi:hypothetical protein